MLRRFMRRAAIVGLMLSGCTAHRPSTATTAPAGTRSFDVRSYGAAGDGRTKDTAAVQRALDACAAAGGGEVVVPAGNYVVGSVTLGPNTTLRLQADATLSGSADAEDYPLLPVRWEGETTQGRRALVYADHADHIAVVGPGRLVGGEGMGSLRHPRGPLMVELVGCNDVRLDGFGDRYRRLWSIHLVYCRGVVARNLDIRTTQSNGDGIDVDSTADVRIEHCDIDTGDDAISLKSGRGMAAAAAAARLARPTENVVIADCALGSAYAGVGIGTEMSGGVRHVRIERCTFTHGANAIFIKSRTGRGGVIEDVAADDLDVGTKTFLGINLVNKGIVGSDPFSGPDAFPTCRDVRISHVKAHCGTLVDGANVAPERPIVGLSISSVTGTCRKAIALANATDVELRDIDVTGYTGPRLATRNVTGTGLDDAVPLPTTRPATTPTDPTR